MQVQLVPSTLDISLAAMLVDMLHHGMLGIGLIARHSEIATVVPMIKGGGKLGLFAVINQ